MSESRARPAGPPSHACPACFEALDATERIVSFDCGHKACLACVTEGLRVLRSSSPAAGSENPCTTQPLACFLGRGSCQGVLFHSETRAVLRRILPQHRPATAPVTEPPPDPDAAAARSDRPSESAASPDSADSDIG